MTGRQGKQRRRVRSEGKGGGCRGRLELGGRGRWGGEEGSGMCTRLKAPGVPCGPGSGVRTEGGVEEEEQERMDEGGA